MKSIRFQELSMSDAEELIILLSLITEKHQIATPKLTSRWHGDRLEIVLTFESKAQRAAVELQIRGYAKDKISRVKPRAIR